MAFPAYLQIASPPIAGQVQRVLDSGGARFELSIRRLRKYVADQGHDERRHWSSVRGKEALGRCESGTRSRQSSGRRAFKTPTIQRSRLLDMLKSV